MKAADYFLFSMALICAVVVVNAQTRAALTGPTVAPWKTPTGTIYEDHTGTTITVTTAGTYYPWISATAGPMVAGMVGDVADAAGDHLIVPIAGTYFVTMNSSYTAGNTDQTKCRVAVDGTGSGVVAWHRTMGVAARVASASSSGTIVAHAGAELRLECTSNTNGDAIVMHNTQLSAMRVGP